MFPLTDENIYTEAWKKEKEDERNAFKFTKTGLKC